MHSNGESRVILGKDTKHFLRPGVVLRFPSEEYVVESVLPGSDRYGNLRSVSITVLCPDGRHIYCTPSSGFYGAEMGACECPGCNRWYNLFGQEIMPPEKWEEDGYCEEWG